MRGGLGQVLRRLARADRHGTGGGCGGGGGCGARCRGGGRSGSSSRGLGRVSQWSGRARRVHGDVCRVRLQVALLVRLRPRQRARPPLLRRGAALPLQGLRLDGRSARPGCGRSLSRRSGTVSRGSVGSGHIDGRRRGWSSRSGSVVDGHSDINRRNHFRNRRRFFRLRSRHRSGDSSSGDRSGLWRRRDWRRSRGGDGSGRRRVGHRCGRSRSHSCCCCWHRQHGWLGRRGSGRCGSHRSDSGDDRRRRSRGGENRGGG